MLLDGGDPGLGSLPEAVTLGGERVEPEELSLGTHQVIAPLLDPETGSCECLGCEAAHHARVVGGKKREVGVRGAVSLGENPHTGIFAKVADLRALNGESPQNEAVSRGTATSRAGLHRHRDATSSTAFQAAKTSLALPRSVHPAGLAGA